MYSLKLADTAPRAPITTFIIRIVILIIIIIIIIIIIDVIIIIILCSGTWRSTVAWCIPWS